MLPLYSCSHSDQAFVESAMSDVVPDMKNYSNHIVKQLQLQLQQHMKWWIAAPSTPNSKA